MDEPFYIRKIAVLGAGVMGGQIAAHCANAGFPTYLFDLSSREGMANDIVNQAIQRLKKLKPSPLATPEIADVIIACNYDDDIEKLTHCDLIIEAIGENLNWKMDLYEKVTPYLSSNAILVSNTSGLSINQLAQVLPESLQSRFCGVHFFNPPRYMQLVELIPAASTSEQLLNHLESWLTSFLGKDVICAKDTPNFIANRIGVFSLLSVMHQASIYGLGFDEVDALTGELIGRPKSATFRTMDVVGLDTLRHVVQTMDQQLTDDPWHSYFQLPDWLTTMINKGYLGQKSGQGIYRKQGKIIEVYDLKLGNYRPAKAYISPAIKEIMNIAEPNERLNALRTSEDHQAKFLVECFRGLFHYCAYHVKTIAYNVRDIDLAMRWGFGWKQGPFEIWELGDVKTIKEWLNEAIDTGQTLASAPLPSWLKGLVHFYVEDGAYSPITNKYQPRSQLPVYRRQVVLSRLANETDNIPNVVFENPGVKLWHLRDDITVISFKTKGNIVDKMVIDGLHQSIDIAEQLSQGLIIHQENPVNFSLGADLSYVKKLLDEKETNLISSMIDDFQRVAMRLKYSSIPTVAALRGRALGGGCELMMHCDKIVAAFESYPGLVEMGVGLLPAGGGLKELAKRAAMQASHIDLMSFVQPSFDKVAKAYVTSSAPDALKAGFLQQSDLWVMNRDEVLYTALNTIKAMYAANYIPPVPPKFRVAGREGKARLQMAIVNYLEGGFISKHDSVIAEQIAHVLCGGDVNQGTLVDESWMLKLEKESFMNLLNTTKTQERIKHILDTGKPLRN